MVCAIETTHDFHAVVPVILVCVIADAIAVRFMPNSIMTEKLARLGFSTRHEYELNALKQLSVADVMARDVAIAAPGDTVRELADRFAAGDLKMSRHQALPIVDSSGRLQGIVTQGDLLRALEFDPSGRMNVRDAGAQSLIVAYPDERVFDAVTKMLNNNIGRLPVVDRDDPGKMVGYINRANVMGSWRGHMREESVREHGWLRNLSTGNGWNGTIKTVTGHVAAIRPYEIRIQTDSQPIGAAQVFILRNPVHGVVAGDEVLIEFCRETDGNVVSRIMDLSRHQ
jgi:CBS domain-containing protein